VNTDRRPQVGLDGVVMRVTATATNGVVDASTSVSFRQRGARVLGRYAGGSVRRGWLVGAVAGNRLDFRYAQAESSGAIHAGRSRCEIQTLADGRLRLLEHFAWSTRAGGGTNVFEQVR